MLMLKLWQSPDINLNRTQEQRNVNGHVIFTSFIITFQKYCRGLVVVLGVFFFLPALKFQVLF